MIRETPSEYPLQSKTAMRFSFDYQKLNLNLQFMSPHQFWLIQLALMIKTHCQQAKVEGAGEMAFVYKVGMVREALPRHRRLQVGSC